jgi:hypothetical protein
MAELTKYDALLCEIEPYTVSPLTIKKALADAGVTEAEGDYDTENDRRGVAKAAILILAKLLVLSSDSLGKSSQGYNTSELNSRIKRLCGECGLSVDDYVEVSTVTDGSNRW